MSEIEKLYEKVGIKICKRKQGFTLKDCTDRDCKQCGYYVMPPFTAEKQLELIKIITNRECFVANYVPKGNIFILSSEDYCGTQTKFSDALAELINNLWQDLTEEEKQQVKGILE